MDGFQKRTETKKQQIIAAAVDLFGRYGFKKVSVDEIAERADVSKVSIYSYFKNKQGLIDHLVAAVFRERKEGIEQLVRSEIPFPEKLQALIAQKSEISGSFSQEFLEQIVQHPEWQNQPAEDLEALVEELLEQGKQEGHISPNASTRAMRLYIEVFRAGTEALPRELAELPPEELRQIITMFFHGLEAAL